MCKTYNIGLQKSLNSTDLPLVAKCWTTRRTKSQNRLNFWWINASLWFCNEECKIHSRKWTHSNIGLQKSTDLPLVAKCWSTERKKDKKPLKSQEGQYSKMPPHCSCKRITRGPYIKCECFCAFFCLFLLPLTPAHKMTSLLLNKATYCACIWQSSPPPAARCTLYVLPLT